MNERSAAKVQRFSRYYQAEQPVIVNGVYISGGLIAEGRGVAAKLEAEGKLYSAGVVGELVVKLEAIRNTA